ncbi:MAG: VanZ family protein [ANME-2 cluster archaeon]|nr:VanZ family protein [ANME-2 cluster archaeon]MBC2701966.1 VanZ family protein [ANME-2 cluster archaeon]MBC2708971.1 VanZ family protein [ANME-2 cluster archaeon]MBC2745763.1 VanZ family protein [ANME-2 cluster archaeon]MBC2764158.1 VanZ family protein [ANME-2 cluster archaeon]
MARDLRLINIFKFFLVLSIIYAVFIFYLSSLNDISTHMGFIEKQYILKIFSFFERFGLGVITKISVFAYSNYDKSMHFILYTGFGIVIYLTMHFSGNPFLRKYTVILVLLIGVLYAITDEMHQSYVPGRSASKADLVADTAGLVFSVIMMPVLIYIQKNIGVWIHRGKTL